MNLKRVVVLMSTYNGEKFLDEQINSLLRQKDFIKEILVRDDGSTDRTQEILEKFRLKGLLSWYVGENKGSAESFMDLIYAAPYSDYYAFCDQDDVWDDDKIPIAIKALDNTPKNIPSLYFSGTKLVDENLSPLGIDNKGGYLLTFEESLFQNPVTGCTVVYNKCLHSKLLSFRPTYISMHDSWVYRVCLALGGNLIYDPCPHIKYRQHENNVVGYSSIWKRFKRRYTALVSREYGERMITATELFHGYKSLLSCDKLLFLNYILNYRASFKNKIKIIFSPNLRIRSVERKLAIVFSILFNKF